MSPGTCWTLKGVREGLRDPLGSGSALILSLLSALHQAGWLRSSPPPPCITAPASRDPAPSHMAPPPPPSLHPTPPQSTLPPPCITAPHMSLPSATRPPPQPPQPHGPSPAHLTPPPHWQSNTRHLPGIWVWWASLRWQGGWGETPRPKIPWVPSAVGQSGAGIWEGAPVPPVLSSPHRCHVSATQTPAASPPHPNTQSQ